MIEKKIQVINKLGLHARPAVMLVQTAGRFKSEIKLFKDEVQVNAKSILGVMGLAAEVGTFVTIQADGEDEAQAVEALAQLFLDKFGEE